MTPDEPESEPFDADAEPPPGYPWTLTAAGIIWTTVGTGFCLVAVGLAVVGGGWWIGDVGGCCLPFTVVFIVVGWDTACGRPQTTLGTALASTILGTVWSIVTLLAVADDLTNNALDGWTFAFNAVNGAGSGSMIAAGVLAVHGRHQLRKREQAAGEVEHEREPE